jgi:subtilisin-like proprotein convertase family protein/cytochrome c553
MKNRSLSLKAALHGLALLGLSLPVMASTQWRSQALDLDWNTRQATLPVQVELNQIPLTTAAGPSLGLISDRSTLLPASTGRLQLPVSWRISGSATSLQGESLMLVDASSNTVEDWLLLTKEGQILAHLAELKLALVPGMDLLVMHANQVQLDAKLAVELGLDDNRSHSLGSLHLEVELAWAGGDAPSALPPLEADFELSSDRVSQGADMTFCQLYGLYQHARSGDYARMALGTTSWNIGDTDLQWTSGLGNRHPYIVQNLFRLEDDRFEQVAVSWIKHGFYALSSFQCDLPDLPNCVFESGHSAGGWLGQGCTDTYSPGLNASGLRPRSEIDPWTGEWTGVTYSGDYSLWVNDNDIDPAQHPSALYYSEGVYNIADDVDPVNSIGWKPVTFTGSPGSTWSVGMTGSSTLPEIGLALDAWGGSMTLVAEEIPVIHENAGGPGDSPDGRAYLAVKSQDLGSGMWHYEYCLYNVDMARAIDSFEIPLSAGTLIQNAGFHAPVQYDPGYSNDAWTITQGMNSISWNTSDNPIRWGVMYTFRFDANQPPEAVTAQVGMYTGTGPASLAAATTGPAQGPADCNSNGTPDDQDIANGTSQDCNTNGVPDECEVDCNSNGTPDDCDIANGSSEDCNTNGIPDECETDCNENGIADACDIAGGFSQDCNGNGVPDECETPTDCNTNGIDDACDIASGSSQDCNENGIPDECDIASGSSLDADGNGIPDECEGICGQIICPSADPVFGTTSGKQPGENHGSSSCGSSGSSPDVFFRYTPASSGTATVQTCDMGSYDTVLSIHTDCPGTTANEIECNDDNCANYRSSITWSVTAGQSYTIRVSGYNNASGDFGLLLDGPPCDVNFPDCNSNGIDDALDISSGSSQDCNTNGIPDECDIDSGTSLDCNLNSIPDECDIASGFSQDCNENGYPDECEFVGGGNGWLDLDSGTLALDIPDNDPAGVSHTLTISQDLPISGMELSLEIGHSYNGDLIVTLEHLASGTSAIVIDRPGYTGSGFGSGADGFSVRLGDSYVDSIEDSGAGGSGLVSGDFLPFPDPLSSFDGLSSAADWRITVTDNAGSDTGQLTGWALHFFQTGNPDNDCNGNGVLDDCDIASGSSLDLNGNGIPDECDDQDPAVWATDHFRAAVVCNKCHNHDPGAGVFDHNGENVSPMHLWEATMMANSSRDPYWRAKVAFEMSEFPSAAGLIESTCLSCHAPMGHLEDQLSGDGNYSFGELANDPAGQEGVSCTLCHQLDPANLGQSAWSGNFSIEGNNSIYGPFAEPQGESMIASTGFVPLEGAHMQDSNLCASCHTLFTPTLDASGQIVGSFPEQTPLLENANSNLSAVSCQSCHMREFADGDVLSTFPPQGLGLRAPTRGHDIVGGNTMMLELMRDNITALDLKADAAQYDSLIAHTERFLAGGISLDAGLTDAGSHAELRVSVQNHAGHKFPTGIPVRRAWLEVVARDAQSQVIFHSGAVDQAGHITGHDSGIEPHHNTISDPAQVQIWEGRFVDTAGNPTWSLMSADVFQKDNRLLPAGWSATGPNAADTAPQGACLADADFHENEGGGDRVFYQLPSATASVVVRLHFQSVNPQVVDAMRGLSDPAVTEFITMWDAADRSGTVIHEMNLLPGAMGDVSRGGRLYDRWWTETGQSAPAGDHPLWSQGTDTVPGAGAESWSCASCHGFDYAGEHGFPSIHDSVLDSQSMINLLSGSHGYGSLLDNQDMLDLVAFVLGGAMDMSAGISSEGVIQGDLLTGMSHYQTATTPACAACHGNDGRSIPFAPGEYLGERARDLPWQTMHRLRFGPAAQQAMPRWHDLYGTDGMYDLGAWLQQLPVEIPVSEISWTALDGITVSWAPVAGVTGYRLEMTDASGQSQTMDAPGADTASVTLDAGLSEPGNVWSIRVVAVWNPVAPLATAPAVDTNAAN